MNSFELDVPAKDIAGADFILRVGGRLVSAARRNRVTRAEIARRLDIDKSTVSKMLRGDANLTLRSVGELCEAIGVDPVFSYKPRRRGGSTNAMPSTWTIARAESGSKMRSFDVKFTEDFFDIDVHAGE